MYSYVIILARCGAKGKPNWTIGNRPLIAWVLAATRNWPGCVSSDQDFSEVAKHYGKTWVQRYPSLCTPEASCEAAVQHVLDTDMDAATADNIHVVLSTSPFIQQYSLKRADLLLGYADLNSTQTVIDVPHNFHEWNQRELKQGEVHWVHERKRRSAARKQQKPSRYAFGNLFSFRRAAFQKEGIFWPDRCAASLIPWWQAIDVDDQDSLDLARAVAAHRKL